MVSWCGSAGLAYDFQRWMVPARRWVFPAIVRDPNVKRCSLKFLATTSASYREGTNMSAIQSLIDAGTKLYLDSVDPEEITKNLAWGAVGATSNPAIISEIIARGLL